MVTLVELKAITITTFLYIFLIKPSVGHILNTMIDQQTNHFMEQARLLNSTRSCPPLSEGKASVEMASESPRLVVRRGDLFACKRVAECEVLTSPPETNIYWYVNGQPVASVAQRDEAMALQPNQQILGFSQTVHRLCVDDLLVPGQQNSFHCVVQSSCKNEVIVKSPEVTLPGPAFAQPKNLLFNQLSGTLNAAPLITMLTSTRMEMAGRYVQLFCHATGSPQPEIEWKVVDEMGEEGKLYPLSFFGDFIKVIGTDVIVDTSKTELASLTLQCTARNVNGVDSAYSALIIVAET